MDNDSATTLATLLQVMERLRDPDIGCPWDVEQNFHSIAPSTIEEAYEVVDAIENNDFEHLQEELGDLLFQVVFYAQMAREQDRFQFSDIVQGLTDKLVRRHPHVFPDGTAASRVDPDNRPSEDFVTKQWEQIKKQERQGKGKEGLLADIPKSLPAIGRAYKLQKRAAEVGFDWPDHQGVMEKLEEEVDELKQALEYRDEGTHNKHSQDREAQDRQAPELKDIADEIGDCFFTLVNLCRHLKLDADSTLRAANKKFTQRFQLMEQSASKNQKPLEQLNSIQMEELWQQAKRSENSLD